MIRTPRRYLRQKVESVVPVDLGPTNGGILLDLGEGGFACRAVSPLVDGQYFRVKFKLLEQGRVDASGQVAWVDESGKRAGFRFLDVPATSYQALRGWLNRDLPFVFEEEEEEEEEKEEVAEFEEAETRPVKSPAEDVAEEASPRGTVSFVADEQQGREAVETPSRAEEVSSLATPQPSPRAVQKGKEEYELLPAYRSILQAQQAAFEQEQLERRRKLIFMGAFGFVALVASLGAFFLLHSGFGGAGNVFADLRRLITWETSRRSAVPPPTPARPAKSTAGKARSRRAGDSRGAIKEKIDEISAPTPAPSETTGKPAKRNVFQLEVVDSTNRRWTVTSRGGKVLSSRSQRSSGLSGLRVEATEGAKGTPASSPTATASSLNTPGGESTGAASMRRELPRDQAIPVVPHLVVMQHRIERGSIILQALIGKDGSVQNIRVVSGPSALAAAVMDLVRLWRYPPYYQDGEPVEVEREIRIDFTISTK